MDGNQDCLDGADEDEPLVNCMNTEYLCVNNGRCIPRYRINDNFADCLGGTDENITNLVCNKETEFNCSTELNRCIPRHWVGNNVKDCQGGVDEIISLSNCTLNELQ